MMKPKNSELIAKITKRIVPTTAIASGLLSQPAFAAPGDLDPTFGDMGRVGPELNLKGPAWSVLAAAGDQTLIAGGEARVWLPFGGCDYYYNHCHADGFIGQISPAGSLDLEVQAAQLSTTEVLDFALQPDGKVVAVGRTVNKGTSQLTVFRLMPGGSLDINFAEHGIRQYTPNSIAQSVLLDPSGAIVVGGSSSGKLMVLRLLANGTPDGSFGSGGVYIGPPTDYSTLQPTDDSRRLHVLRTASGEYRVSANLLPTDPSQPPYCAVLALTATGTLNTSFGASGIAAPSPSSAPSINCASIASQSDGALLLGGQEDNHGFVGRLLASGAPDPSFAASAVQDDMRAVTALAVDASDSILVGGQPSAAVPGSLIMRLQATGLLDALFGDHGSTWIDLSSSAATSPAIYDMKVLADGRILGAGGELSTQGRPQEQPLLIRLVGTTEPGGAGVIGATQSTVAVKEQDQSAVVTIRRTGGATGPVSVKYRTADYTGGDAPSAKPGTDYAAVTGQLTWADGDRSDRQITIPVLTAGRVEEPKRFAVTLDGATGGAKFGTQATVEVATDGDRAGELGFAQPAITANPADGSVQMVVNRNYYSTGSVSVTLTPVPGTATSADFSTTPLTLSWADGDSGSQTATITIVKSGSVGPPKSFTVDLSNPTNGAVLGPQAHAVVTIASPPPPPPPSGGGGAFDWFALLCLGWIPWLRRRALARSSADDTN
jgi:uncharacterized delta-60 repeat protein